MSAPGRYLRFRGATNGRLLPVARGCNRPKADVSRETKGVLTHSFPPFSFLLPPKFLDDPKPSIDESCEANGEVGAFSV